MSSAESATYMYNHVQLRLVQWCSMKSRASLTFAHCNLSQPGVCRRRSAQLPLHIDVLEGRDRISLSSAAHVPNKQQSWSIPCSCWLCRRRGNSGYITLSPNRFFGEWTWGRSNTPMWYKHNTISYIQYLFSFALLRSCIIMFEKFTSSFPWAMCSESRVCSAGWVRGPGCPYVRTQLMQFILIVDTGYEFCMNGCVFFTLQN